MRPQAILRRAADTFGVTIADLTGPGRARHLVRARFAAAWAIKRLCPLLSLVEIGKVLGGRDHNTIINALQQAETFARHDETFRSQMWSLLDEEQMAPARRTPISAPARAGERWWIERSYRRPRTTPAA